jgi:hypothetical protein
MADLWARNESAQPAHSSPFIWRRTKKVVDCFSVSGDDAI